MGVKLYEAYDCKTKKKYWWTQRDKSNNCFEIRQSDNGKFLLLVNEVATEPFDTFAQAEKKIKEMWVS